MRKRISKILKCIITLCAFCVLLTANYSLVIANEESKGNTPRKDWLSAEYWFSKSMDQMEDVLKPEGYSDILSDNPFARTLGIMQYRDSDQQPSDVLMQFSKDQLLTVSLLFNPNLELEEHIERSLTTMYGPSKFMRSYSTHNENVTLTYGDSLNWYDSGYTYQLMGQPEREKLYTVEELQSESIPFLVKITKEASATSTPQRETPKPEITPSPKPSITPAARVIMDRIEKNGVVRFNNTVILSEPDMSSHSIGRLNQDDTINIVGVSQPADSENGWYEIELRGNKGTGFINKRYVTVSEAESSDKARTESKETSHKADTQFRELKVGSKGQDVLDARTRLYELGYFQKKPTQLEYTNSMSNYVKQFEADYGLKTDGVLSVDDQIVLFSSQTSAPLSKPSNIKVKVNKDASNDGKTTKSTVLLTWDKVTDAKKYIIERSMNKDFQHVVTKETVANQYTDSSTLFSTEKNTTAYYRIQAVNEDRKSVYSKTVTASVPPYYTEPSCPLELKSVSVGHNSIGTPEVYVNVKNNSKKESIDAFTFQTTCYNAYGTPLKAHGFGDTTEYWIWQEGVIKPKKSWSSNNWRWTLYGFEEAYTIEVTLVDVHTTSGKTIKYSPSSGNTIRWSRY